jgi:hypothetical protein
MYDTVFAHKMIAMGNFGHAILQNILPLVKMMKKVNMRGKILLLNDCKNCGMPGETCVDGQGSYGYASCGIQRDNLYKMVFGSDPIDWKKWFDPKLNPLSEAMCFENLVLGMDGTFDMLNEPQPETYPDLKDTARQAVYDYLGLSTDIKPTNTINIVVYCKINGRHGGGITNCGYVPNLVSEVYRNRYKGKRVVVEMINFDMVLDVQEQFRIISRAHIYIANGGSSSYYTLFLKKGAVSMIVPQCDDCKCFDLFPSARITPNVTYMSVSPHAITCPTERCAQPEFPDCGGQWFALLESFKDELDKGLEVAHLSTQ